ncbi:MAG: tRNA dihydrouridine synthase DusB [Candidatus Nanopelagicales bacterium]
MDPVSPLVVPGLTVAPPVVLAPMAGITNRAFRRLCREQGAGLYVSEMVTARAFLEDNDKTRRLITFDADETPRSLQFYSVDPGVLGEAVRRVADEDLADHVDLNFGCPVPKVTRKGGGSALPWKTDLFRALVAAAVGAADGRLPVTVKMRMGIDADHLTYLDAGLAAEQEGAAWVALHARTAEQFYGGTADWDAIARLKDSLRVPVLGNGDIWSAQDAADMMARTGCDGVVVGRGCLGRPWLFGQLADLLSGQPERPDPDLRGVIAGYRRHAHLLVEAFGTHIGCREIRKHHAWYFKGFSVPRQVRAGLGQVSDLAEIDELLGQIDPDQPAVSGSGPRGRTGHPRSVALPQGWLDSRTVTVAFDRSAAEIDAGGG